MSNLNNKHLPSDLDSLTKKDLVEIFHIHMEEMQLAQKLIATLEGEKQALVSLIIRNAYGEAEVKGCDV